MVQAGISAQAEAQPKAKAMWCAAMYLATHMQSSCLGQKSLREGVRTAQVEIPIQACIDPLIL